MTASPQERRVRVAVATLCFDGFDDLDFVPAFAGIPELGVLDVEFNCWYPRTLTPSGLDSIVARCERIGARPICLQILSPTSQGELGSPGAELARWMWLLEAARRIGAPMIKTTGTARDGDGSALGRVIETLRTVAPIAADLGITIALENHFRNTVEFPCDYERVFTEIPDGNVGMCLDTGHFAASGVDMPALVDAFGSRIVHIDLKDCAQQGAGRFVPFGEGIVDFDGVLAHAVGAGYRGHLLIEYPRADPAAPTLDQLRAGDTIARRHCTVRPSPNPEVPPCPR